MYANHQPEIMRWARRSPDNLARVVQFCIVSAREKFYNVPALLDDAEQGRPSTLWGWKHRAYHEAWIDRHAIHHHCEAIADYDLGHEHRQADYLVAYLATLHGLNCAKAGFVAQLAYGVSACLDAINTEKYGLPPRAWANLGQRKTSEGRLKLAQRYNNAVYNLGGPRVLWDSWCETVHERYPAVFCDPDHVSRWHLECTVLRNTI